MKAINIRTEYLENPIGINKETPRITWEIDSFCYQKSYRIFGYINDKPFDTSFINSNNMYYDFEYKLNERDIVIFYIELIDDSNNRSEISDTNRFEIGIDDFKDAKFISGNYIINKNKRYPVDYFKKDFIVSKVKKARLYITSHGINYSYINGIKTSNEIFQPGFSDYNKRLKISTYDVTSLIKEGNNTLSIELGDGWYKGSIGAKGRCNTYGNRSKVICLLILDNNDGSTTYIKSDNTFDWSNDGSIIFNDLKDGEVVNLNKTPSYKYKAKEIKTKQVFDNLNTNPVIENEVFDYINTIKHKNSIVYEFKQNLAGYFYIKLKNKQDKYMKVVMGEMLDDKSHVTLKNVQCKHKGKLTPLQECHIYLKDGINEYKPKYFFGGFKYIEIYGDIKLIELKQIAVYSILKEASSFECSNELINIFHNNTLWSLKSNSIDIPSDCPTRERMGWTGDSQVFFNTASYLVNYEAFARKHIIDIFDRQWKNGKVAQIVPFSNEDWFMNPMNGSVGWADACVLIPYRYYLKYGDDRLLKKYFNNIIKYALFMIKRCGREKGIYSIYAKKLHMSKENKKYQVNTGQSYGEWAEPNDVKAFVWTDFCEPHPEESMAYTSYILNLVLEIERLLNKDDYKDLISEYSNGVKKAYQELVSKDKFSLDTNRQAKLVRPLYMKLLNKDQEEYAKERLKKALENYDFRLGTGFLSTPFILDVLKDIDIDYCFKLLLNTKMPGWLFMALNNTGTIWEGWEGPLAQQGISSLNHYSKGAMVEWLYSSLLGIKLNGSNSFIIEPIINDKYLQYYKGSYHSIYGEISVSINNKKIEVVVPGNTTCTLKYLGHTKILNPGKHIINI